MLRYASVLALGLAGLGAIQPPLAWLYVAMAATFEAWLAGVTALARLGDSRLDGPDCSELTSKAVTA